MFEQFKKFVGSDDEQQYTSANEFLASIQGKTFLNGMFRVFKVSEIEKWCKIVEQSFPAYKNQVDVFSYDWLGRIFALSKTEGTVLMFEPGTGEVLDIPADLVNFFNIEIAEHHEDSLASTFFNEWYETQQHYVLKPNECAGYKVPLFLNGDDVVDNLEVSDMEVYWEIMMPLINL
ncbi:MAG: DUF1851 domain-containing protein [Lachnospiraceae bacterium]|nr:DUF1851 domain-containing protein [Lachnospiraceae bacterium]